MYEGAVLEEYRSEIRGRVCGYCLHRPPGGPPCAALGTRCRIEFDLPQFVNSIHRVRSQSREPCIDDFRDHVCLRCTDCIADQCPCPLQFQLGLAVQAIDAVDQRRAQRTVPVAAAS